MLTWRGLQTPPYTPSPPSIPLSSSPLVTHSHKLPHIPFTSPSHPKLPLKHSLIPTRQLTVIPPPHTLTHTFTPLSHTWSEWRGNLGSACATTTQLVGATSCCFFLSGLVCLQYVVDLFLFFVVIFLVFQVHPARYISLVDEADLHIPTMTVEDTLAFAYRCNSTQPKDAHVKTIMEVSCFALHILLNSTADCEGLSLQIRVSCPHCSFPVPCPFFS